MDKKKIFHLVSFTFNIPLIFLSGYISSFFLIELNQDDLYFVKKGVYFNKLFTLLLLCFSWLSTFAIYRYRNHKKHFIIFVFINIILSLLNPLIYNILEFLKDENNNRFSYLYLSIINCFEETILLVIFTSTFVYYSQMIIGKKLLPALYKNPKTLDSR